jgi:Family of unknown function (DUF6084)
MTATRHQPARARNEEIPNLRFAVAGAEAVAHAAVPTLTFTLQVDAPPAVPIRSVLLDVQIQIAARQRSYDAAAQEQLLELFGTPDRWATTLRTLPWLRTTVVVPPFTGSARVEVPVPCSYDLEVSASRYFAALSDGEIPLEFLFSGSVFFAGEGQALRTARIALDTDIEFRLPASVWRAAIDRHFPDAAWLRLGRPAFDALAAFKARGAYSSWDAAIESLLGERSA